MKIYLVYQADLDERYVLAAYKSHGEALERCQTEKKYDAEDWYSFYTVEVNYFEDD